MSVQGFRSMKRIAILTAITCFMCCGCGSSSHSSPADPNHLHHSSSSSIGVKNADNGAQKPSSVTSPPRGQGQPENIRSPNDKTPANATRQGLRSSAGGVRSVRHDRSRSAKKPQAKSIEAIEAGDTTAPGAAHPETDPGPQTEKDTSGGGGQESEAGGGDTVR